MIDLNIAGKLLLNKHLLQVDMSLGVVDQLIQNGEHMNVRLGQRKIIHGDGMVN